MTRIQLRHDTATNWTTANPILAEGEVGVETDTNKFKIGDGVTTWSELAYQGDGGGGGDFSNYYTKTQTDELLENKEDTITAVNPLTLTKISKNSLEGFTYSTNTTIVPNTYVTTPANEGNRYPVDILNTNHLSSSYILMPFHNDYVYKIPLEVQYPYSSIMFGYFEEGVWVPVIQVHGPGTAVYYYKPSTTFTYTTASNGNYFLASNSQSYNSATAYNQEDVTSETQEIIDSYTGAIQLHIVDTADSGTDNFAIDLLHYTNTNKTSYTARTLVWSSQTQAEDRAHLNKITHIAILPTQLSMPSGGFFSTTSLGMYEHTGRLGWTPTAFFEAIDGQENLFDINHKEAEGFLELNTDTSLTVQNNILGVNPDEYYNQTQTDNLLDDKADDFIVTNPITLEAPATSSLSFNTNDKGNVNYDYETGEYYYGFASDRTMFDIVIDIPSDINIDVYSDYWKIGDSSLSFNRTQPNTSANANIFEIYANNGTENVTVSRLWYGSSHYRAGNSTSSISSPFQDGIAKHTANNTTVYSGSGNDNIANGYSANIVSGNRLSRIILCCMCQCSGSWGTEFYSASWGNYWSDSTGARLKSLKLYTSANDTEGIELIRYAIAKPTLTLNTDNTLEVDSNGLLTTAFKTQGVSGLKKVTQTEYDEIGTYYAYVYSGSTVYVRKATPTTTDTVYTGIDTESSLTITSVGTDSITLSDGNTYTYSETDNVIDTTQYDSTIVYVTI